MYSMHFGGVKGQTLKAVKQEIVLFSAPVTGGSLHYRDSTLKHQNYDLFKNKERREPTAWADDTIEFEK